MPLSPKDPVILFLIVAVILDIVAVAIPYWYSTGTAHGGLWKACVADVCVDIPTISDEMQTMRGLHMFALIIGVVTLVIYIVTALVELLSKKKRMPLIVILSLIAGAFILIANIYMAQHILMDPTCHAMSLISSFFFIYVGGFLTSSCCPSE